MTTPARALVDDVLAQHATLCRGSVDAGLTALAAAALLEDSLGITLADADLDPAVLGDPAAVRLLLDRLTGFASRRSA